MNWLLNSNNEKQKSMECHLQSTEREGLPNEKSALQENILHGENKTKQNKNSIRNGKNERIPHQQTCTKEIRSSSDIRKIQPRWKPK